MTLPVEVRKRLGLKKGDLVAISETEDGLLITPSRLLATKALDRIGEVLRAQGSSLEELMESGREIRRDLIEKEYGLSDRD